MRDAVFGDNCFGGPGIRELEITERGGVVQSLKVCVSAEQDGPMKCQVLVTKEVSMLRGAPITQAKLNEYAAAK